MKILFAFIVSWLCLFQLAPMCLAQVHEKEMKPGPAPADNPLRGLVPYDYAPYLGNFEHSMEYRYFSLKDIMTEQLYQYDWKVIDGNLTQAQQRGMQLLFRVYIEYPGRGDELPGPMRKFVGVTTWTERKGEGETTVHHTPDYSSPDIGSILAHFIAALGERYNRDPRVGFIEVGLLGMWGEWHTYPREELMASKSVQREVMDAFKGAFPDKKIMLRYPAGPSDARIAENTNEPFGYHDDSFGHSTIGSKSWYFMQKMRVSNAMNKSKKYPIGGEIFPNKEVSDVVFTSSYKGQDFSECIKQTNLSFVRANHMFYNLISEDRKQRARQAVAEMGYNLEVTRARHVTGGRFYFLEVYIKNTGVAPFYYDWPVHVRSSTGEHVVSNWGLSYLEPGGKLAPIMQ